MLKRKEPQRNANTLHCKLFTRQMDKGKGIVVDEDGFQHVRYKSRNTQRNIFGQVEKFEERRLLNEVKHGDQQAKRRHTKDFIWGGGGPRKRCI